MELKSLEADRFADKPAATIQGALIYGANYGLGQEYIHRIVKAFSAEAREMRAAECLHDPALLNDAINSTSLFGDKTVVWVREAGDKFTDTCAEALGDEKAGSTGNFVIIEAGELGKTSRLRKLFEGVRHLAAIPCYIEKGPELGRTIADMLAAENITLSTDARQYLIDRAPADRLALRGDIERLVLYIGAGNKVELLDAQACLGDAADADAFELPWAVFDGKVQATDTTLTRLEGEGSSGIMVLRMLLSHAIKLHFVQSLASTGKSTGEATKALRPPLFYNQESRFQGQLKRWNLNRLTQVICRLNETEIQCKSTGYPADALVRQLALLMAAQP